MAAGQVAATSAMPRRTSNSFPIHSKRFADYLGFGSEPSRVSGPGDEDRLSVPGNRPRSIPEYRVLQQRDGKVVQAKATV